MAIDLCDGAFDGALRASVAEFVQDGFTLKFISKNELEITRKDRNERPNAIHTKFL